MDYGITRGRALDLLKQQLSNQNLIKHCLASEAVMRALARHFSEDEELWGLTGLLHDLDVELTLDDPARHTHETARILKDEGVAEEIIDAIRMHNAEAAYGTKRKCKFHYALSAGETITGLITATALVYPDKKIASVKPKSVRKRYKEKMFAAGADRNIIAECELIGLSIPDFCDLCLEAMQGIADDLGL